MTRFIALVACLTMGSLLYVYTEVEAVKIGYAIRKQEEAKTLAQDRARALKYNIARLKSPNNLERRLLAQRIQLESPKEWQTLVLSNPNAQAQRAIAQPWVDHSSLFGKLFVGTAQAEAKETSTRS